MTSVLALSYRSKASSGVDEEEEEEEEEGERSWRSLLATWLMDEEEEEEDEGESRVVGRDLVISGRWERRRWLWYRGF